MKTVHRILVGILGLAAMIMGIRQCNSGIRQIAGTSVDKQPQVIGDPMSIAAHSCALRVPKGWREKAAPSGGTMFVSPKESGHSANLIVMSEAFAGSLREYADANIAGVKTVSPAATFNRDEAFASDSGAPSFRASFANKMEDLEVAQAMYFFDGPPGRKIVVTTTVPAADAAALQPLLDSCLKTLTINTP
jgi:hypothetical protein